MKCNVLIKDQFALVACKILNNTLQPATARQASAKGTLEYHTVLMTAQSTSAHCATTPCLRQAHLSMQLCNNTAKSDFNVPVWQGSSACDRHCLGRFSRHGSPDQVYRMVLVTVLQTVRNFQYSTVRYLQGWPFCRAVGSPRRADTGRYIVAVRWLASPSYGHSLSSNHGLCRRWEL